MASDKPPVFIHRDGIYLFPEFAKALGYEDDRSGRRYCRQYLEKLGVPIFEVVRGKPVVIAALYYEKLIERESQ